MKIETKIQVYKVDGKDTNISISEISIKSHWNRNSFCIIEIDGKSITVSARDLERAIKNATNHGF